MNKTLVCTKCLEEKDITLFVKSKLVKCGYTATCKSCYNSTRNEKDSKKVFLPQENKLCPTCKNVLSKDHFYKNPRHSSGLATECIVCTRIRSHSNGLKRKESDKIKAKERYDKNIGKRRAEKRNYILANPEVHMYSAAKKRSRDRGLEFNICKEDIVIPKICPILQVEFKVGTKRDYRYSPSLDRIDNAKGYTKGNIQVISSLANTMKNSATKEELLLFSKYMINRYNDDIVQPIENDKSIELENKESLG